MAGCKQRRISAGGQLAHGLVHLDYIFLDRIDAKSIN
jgi:hypothetical protein